MCRAFLLALLSFSGMASAQSPLLSIGTTEAEIGRTVSATLNIDGLAAAEVFAFRLEVAFDPTIATAQAPSRTGTLTDGWSVAANTSTPGRLIISAAGATALPGDGLLLELRFDGVAVGSTALVVTEARLNEGTPSVMTENGRLDIVEATNVEMVPPDRVQPNILDLYPNPTTGTIHATLSANPSSLLRVWVVDMLGRTQLVVPVTQIPGQHDLRIDAATLPPGAYAVCMADSDGVQACRGFSKVAQR
ncbi:MAG: T9SS type A sorting domain-containing protein [Bacteroidota bacterium]